MKSIVITISDLNTLNQIQKSLANGQFLTSKEQTYLIEFLNHIPASELVLEQIPTPEPIEFATWDMKKLDTSLEQWEKLFWNLPGFDFAPNCYILDNDSPELLAQNFVMVVLFAPSLSYNEGKANEPYHVKLKADGTARFSFPTFEDAEHYPELYNFKGTWKEAYLLLIETLKKGWPMEEFPEELLPLLKK